VPAACWSAWSSGRRCVIVSQLRKLPAPASVDRRGVKDLLQLTGGRRAIAPARGPSSATGLPATVIVNRSPDSARRTTSLTLLRSSRCEIVVMAPPWQIV
jgi:hypothetical protein